MKLSQAIATNALVFCFIVAAHGAENPHSSQTNSTTKATGKSTKSTQKVTAISSLDECGRGYVVSISVASTSSTAKWDDWTVWLSKTGQSYANSDKKLYKATQHSTTDYNSGRIMYAAVLQAMATGAMVVASDWGSFSTCSGTNTYEGAATEFSSVRIYYP